MKKIFSAFLILAIVIALGACNEPIFYTISKEVPIKKPRIGGSPTNFVEFSNAMFVASGKNIWKYESGSWTSYGQNKWIGQLAAATVSMPPEIPTPIPILFALCDDGFVKAFDSSMTISAEIPEITKSIFAANNMLFIGNQDDSISYILTNGGGDINYNGSILKAELRGVAYDESSYYLCTNSGIYYVSTLASTQSTVNLIAGSAINFVGIITLNNTANTVVAITRDGKLYKIETSSISEIVSFGGKLANGVLALWTNGTNNLLLAGRQDELTYSTTSGYTYGYMEIEFDNTGIIGSDFREPGKHTISSVNDYDLYESTLRIKPVGHIFQVPAAIDSNITLFASTQQNGVWSYRERDGILQWNAEE